MGIGAQVMVKQEAAYGTAETVDVALPFLEEGVEAEHKRIEGKNQRANQLVQRNDQFEPYLIGGMGPFSTELTTKDAGWLLKWAMGGLSSGSVSDSVYPHTFTIAATLPSFTFQSNHEQPDGTDRAFTWEGCKFTKWSIEGGKESPVVFSGDIVAEDYSTATALASASYTSGAELLTTVLASVSLGGAAVTVDSWKIEVDNNLDTDRIRQRLAASGGPRRLEPIRKGLATVSWSASVDFVSLAAYNRFAATTRSGALAALAITCQGPTLAGTSAYPQLVATIAAARTDAAKGTEAKGSEASMLVELSGVGLYDGSNSALGIVYSNTQSGFA